MSEQAENVFLTVGDLKTRWRKNNTKSIYRMLSQYSEILEPVKIGRAWLVSRENVEKFESQQRQVNDSAK